MSSPDQGSAARTNTAEQTFIPPDDIAGHIELYDAALCCATDEATLTEIAEEFIERLSALPRQGREQAEIIFEKHQARLGHALTPTSFRGESPGKDGSEVAHPELEPCAPSMKTPRAIGKLGQHPTPVTSDEVTCAGPQSSVDIPD